MTEWANPNALWDHFHIVLNVLDEGQGCKYCMHVILHRFVSISALFADNFKNQNMKYLLSGFILYAQILTGSLMACKLRLQCSPFFLFLCYQHLASQTISRHNFDLSQSALFLPKRLVHKYATEKEFSTKSFGYNGKMDSFLPGQNCASHYSTMIIHFNIDQHCIS